eukprot:TRINITY_DN35474_c0_g1_i2.p3 TRINITY_DN35474_c0_g1~~TRINITY_DN35474_c0_g1_i2.p3  ORF type:complete len:101 (-),score=19.95 TRINITY_DN35474_c0_g1_i2:124-426(-)
MVKLVVEFSGGMELLFGNQKESDLELQVGKDDGKLRVIDVMRYCRDNLLVDRPELFMKEDALRPGILVLINDTDWELCGQANTEIAEGDRVVFISTLHGG